MAELFLVATSENSSDARQTSLMRGLMRKHCQRFHPAGRAQLDQCTDYSGHYAFFLEEFISDLRLEDLQEIAEKIFNVSWQEYDRRFDQWQEKASQSVDGDEFSSAEIDSLTKP